MKDLKYLQYFEDLALQADNALVEQAKKAGKVCIASICENTPEPLMDLDGAFTVRLSAPQTYSTDIASYYMTNFLCENSRSLLERAIEGGYNFVDGLVSPDGCTMINRAAENMELLHTMDEGKEKFFYSYMEIPLKNDENNLNLYVLQCKNHILKPMHENYGIDVSEKAIRKAVRLHNEVCRLIRKIGEFRKEEYPRITSYEFHVLCTASYTCPKYLIVDKLKETLEELKTREPDRAKNRIRVVLVGSNIEDSSFIRLVEEAGAYVCADRFCFGSFPGRNEIPMNSREDALTQICRAYMQRCACPRMMNMEKVYGRKQDVADLAKEYNADGIIYEQVKFCDPWAYERTLGTQMLREDYGYPVLSIDRPYNIGSTNGQLRTRVQAFVESVEIKALQRREAAK